MRVRLLQLPLSLDYFYFLVFRIEDYLFNFNLLTKIDPPLQARTINENVVKL
jgi:hypothetical protein